jgi:hypothetical protein
MLPVVDLTLPGCDRDVRHACITHGFFYLTNHGIDAALMAAVLDETRRFCDLPLDVKVASAVNANHRGYTRMEEEWINRRVQTRGDTKEGYYIGVEIPETDPRASKPMHGPNVWPDERDAPDFRRVMETYHAAMVSLGVSLRCCPALRLSLLCCCCCCSVWLPLSTTVWLWCGSLSGRRVARVLAASLDLEPVSVYSSQTILPVTLDQCDAASCW